MCGLAGIVRRDREAPAAVDAVSAMTATLVHRGPDAGGLVSIGPAALGHRRLSIIDHEGGAQPFVSEDGRVAIVFNGEIYNFEALRTRLAGRGHVFRTRSDTEVLLRSYLEWGEECVSRLRGMFAFAVYDHRSGTVLLARDRLGIKPLFYAETPDGLLFGSELSAVLAADIIPKDIDPLAVLDYLSVRYVPAPRTIVAAARKLPPAHTLVYRSGQARIKRYWDLAFEPDDSLSPDVWRAMLVDKLREAVRLRMVADVPLGAFLSGGVDSSSVVALMSELSGEPVRTSTIGFTEGAYDELEGAGATARHLRTDHREYVARADAGESMRFLGRHYDEPFGDSSAIPTWHVSRLTRRRVKVALSGDGADENFGGYRRYRFDVLENRIRCRVPSLLRSLLLRPAAALWPSWGFLPRPLRARTLLTNVSGPPDRAYFRSLAARSGFEKRGLLSTGLRDAVGTYDPADRFRDLYNGAPAGDPLGKALYVDINTWLPGDILTKVDRASMAVGLEVRVPFLDHELVELAARMPSRLKLDRGRGKAILKDAMAPRLPASVPSRRKRGFAMPVREWLRGGLRDFAHDALFGNGSRVSELFDETAVRGLWKRHQAGRFDESDMLWMLVAFEAWSRAAGTRAGRQAVPGFGGAIASVV